MRMRRAARVLAVGTACALVLAACGADDDAGDDADGDSEQAAEDAGDDSADGAEDEDAGGEDTEDEAVGDGPGEPIVIGALTSFTGPFTPWGVQARAGMQLAADEINGEGGVGGRMIEIVEADDQNDPDAGITELERMVEQEGVLAVGGVISSSVGVAVADVAEELETPLFVVKSGSPAVLTADSRYTFRTCLPSAPMTAPPLLQYAEENGIERVGGIIAEYAWGEGVQAALEETFADSDIELQIESAPVDASDFNTYLRSLQEFDPQIIAATGHPPGAGPITIQASDLGLDVPVTGPYAPLATVVEGVGEVAYDNYADYGCADYSSEDYQELATRFAEESEFSFMEDDAVAGYAIVKIVAEAVENGATDATAVAEYAHDNEFDMPGYSHVLSWTEFGELAASQPSLSIIRGEAPPEGVNPGADWYPEVLSISDPLEPFQP